jgi:general secretion pathway protein J
MIKGVIILRHTGFCGQKTIRQNRVKQVNHLSFSEDTLSGFTIIELLLAIFILAIMFTAIFGGLNDFFGNIPVVTQKGELYEMGCRCMKRISLDLWGIHVTADKTYAPPDLNGPSDRCRILGGNRYNNTYGTHFLRFSSNEHVALDNSPEVGISEIVYYRYESREGEVVLKRSDRLYRKKRFHMDENDPVICEAVEKLKFTFYDTEGNEYDTWDSDSKEFDYATPAAVGILLKLHKKAGIHSFQTKIALPVTRNAKNEDEAI